MSVEQQVDALATSVDELKAAVVTKKATLDASVTLTAPDRSLANKPLLIVGTIARDPVAVTSPTVVRLFLEQLWFKFVPVFHRLQGRLAA